ncbi:MAG: hypothetical protein ACYC6N_19715 [Pirellulaceae bacterium]
MPAGLLILVAFTATTLDPTYEGCIGGLVVNQSHDNQPVCGARVVLQMKSNGDFKLLDETLTDGAGRFLFCNLLVSPYVEYKTSADYEGIHYPGPRVQLTSQRNTAAATLGVRDIVHEPNPLRVRAHEIYVRSSTGVLEVTESLWVENPTDKTYVGPVTKNVEDLPITLQLSIPSDFQKVTFHQEFFGRSFAMRQGKLVTSIPWEPGKREVKFTYFMRIAHQDRLWQRTVDLPTDELRICIATTAPEQVSSNLEPRGSTRRAGYFEVHFASSKTPLLPQHVVRCQLEELPLPWTWYGKWIAALLLITVILCGSIANRRRPRGGPRRPGDAQMPGDVSASRVETLSTQKRAARKQLRRTA